MSKKPTDNEIVKALEDYRNSTIIQADNGAISIGDILDLINRLQAENERLLRKTQRPQDADPMDFCGVLCDFAEGLIVKAKAKAYKEFAERLNKEIDIRPTYSNKQNEYVCFLIDNLLKELVGDK